MKTIKIQTGVGIREADVFEEFECVGRKFAITRHAVKRRLRVVTDFLTGYMIGIPEYGIQNAKNKAIIIIESHSDFDYSKYPIINGPLT
ncbi:MAG: hypothetical protein LLF95_11400 [Bacteroidales bacterium]|nr:hypothetical protein [Bacteroidales bacterium]